MFQTKFKKLREEKKLTEIANKLLQGWVKWLEIENQILLNQLKMMAQDLDVREKLICNFLDTKTQATKIRKNPFLEGG